MDQTFLISINCEEILFGFQKTHFTMFIDTSKISTVYELVEWIRWIFSLKFCIYLTHQNSVIHELEDIRVLSTLKDFELKPCGQLNCIHKNPYKTLLKNQNFLNWNGIKVPRYFFEKICQINKKRQEKITTNDHLKVNETEVNQGIVENGNINIINHSITSKKKKEASFDNKRGALIDNSELESDTAGKSSVEINLNKKTNPDENLLICPEESTDCSNNSDLVSKNLELNDKNYVNFSTVSPTKDKSETSSPSNKNCTESSSKKRLSKFVRPFSLGEILSNIREDMKKQIQEDEPEKNVECFTNAEVENFDETNRTVFAKGNTKVANKRKRIRKRKKSKRQSKENEYFTLPILESKHFIENFNSLHSNTNCKPNHIRFDVENEGNLMETDFVKDDLRVLNENETEFFVGKEIKSSDTTLLKTEFPKLTVANDICQDFLTPSVVSFPVKCASENKVESLEIKREIQNEDTTADLNDQLCDDDNYQSCSASESFETLTLNQDVQMLQSLKDKFKNVVIKRYY